MSSGKSTLINALLGDSLAHVGFGKTTSIPQIFTESTKYDIKDIAAATKKANREAQELLRQQLDEYNKRSIIYWFTKFKPTFDEFPNFRVKPSHILTYNPHS